MLLHIQTNIQNSYTIVHESLLQKEEFVSWQNVFMKRLTTIQTLSLDMVLGKINMDILEN